MRERCVFIFRVRVREFKSVETCIKHIRDICACKLHQSLAPRGSLWCSYQEAVHTHKDM
jgi:hypothetical protein